MKCPLCKCNHNSLDDFSVYQCTQLPIFQNKVFGSQTEAIQTLTGKVTLTICSTCSFVFNSDFDIQIMDYNEEYQNEQAYSSYFQNYLEEIVNLLENKGFRCKKVVEIGCGKGYFLEKLMSAGFDIIGFDPAYEGHNPNIIKDFFSRKYSNLGAELIILRHTLEHIPNPYDFLNAIIKANNYKGAIYIEVPSLEWILRKQAFWDLYHEHCNYFTMQTLGSIFSRSEQGLLFNGQYQFIMANLSDLKNLQKAWGGYHPQQQAKRAVKNSLKILGEKLNFYKKYVRENGNIAIWGAGAKGSTFLNIIDPKRKFVKCVIDKNPKKQEKFIAKTGHKIICPNELPYFDIDTILVMNENYLNEIRSIGHNHKDLKIESL